MAIGFLPTIVLAILKAADTGENFWVILAGALIVFIVVQAIQDGFLVPRIMGKITGLNPAIILLSLSIWGSLLGMLGMIIALPLTTLMLSYYQRFIINKEKIKYDRHEVTDNQSLFAYQLFPDCGCKGSDFFYICKLLGEKSFIYFLVFSSAD